MKAAIKSVDITPAIGMQMAGYSERDHGAEGVHDPICVKIIVIDDGSEKIAYALCDVVGVDLFVTTKVREIVSSSSDIKPENIMVGAIHTHSSVFACRLNGQNFMPTTQFDEESDNAYYQQFIRKIANGILWANRDLQEAKIGFGKGTITGLGTNRNDVNAYYDESVNVIKLEDINGKLMGAIINHACHPTVLGESNYLFSADYVGYVRQHLQDMYPDAKFVFSQGAAGSASTRYTKKGSTFKEADRLSQILVGEVIKVLAKIETTSDIKVCGKTAELVLPVKEFPSEEQCLADIENYKNILAKLEKEKAPRQEIRRAYVTLQGAERNYQKKKNINVDKITTQMQSLNFGVCSLVGIPADVFAEIGRDIRLIQNQNEILVAGYTNDFVSYIVSKEGYEMDCYEKNMTITNEKAHDLILDVAKQLMY